MTVFANKDAFQSLGIEAIQPSASHAAQDCTICAQPLAMHQTDSSPKSKLRGYHDAVRITACGHTHGAECLTQWLNVGNSCPKCDRILFEISGDTITQADIDNITYMLGPMYGEARVNVALVALMEEQERDHAALRRVHEQEVARQKMEEDQKGFDERFSMGDDDWADSDGEMDFEEGGDFEDEEDGGEVGETEEKDVEEMVDDVD